MGKVDIGKVNPKYYTKLGVIEKGNEMVKDYPKSYHPVDTCFNCVNIERIDGKHIGICKDLYVGIWCICDDYVHDVRCDL
jgi:hypothetical protein